MKIGYNKAIGIFMFIPSLLSCCLAAVIVQSDQDPPMVTAGMFWTGIVLGILYLTRPYFEVTENKLVIKALVGPLAKRIPFSSPKDFSVDGGNIYITQSGTRQKVNLVRWAADKKGWDAFVQWIENSQGTMRRLRHKLYPYKCIPNSIEPSCWVFPL